MERLGQAHSLTTTNSQNGLPAMNDYLVIYEQGEDGGWGAHAPDLQGVFALGVTRGECEDRMRGAIQLHFELLHEEGSEIPVPVHTAGYIAA